MSVSIKRQIIKYIFLSGLTVLGMVTLLILLVFVGGTPHVPRFATDTLSSSEVRYVLYDQLERDASKTYQLDLSAGETLDLSLIVPDKILTEVRVPAITITGPDWELVYSDDERSVFSNSASLQDWIQVQPVHLEVPGDGQYQLEVYDEVGEPGKFALWIEGRDPIKINELALMLVGTIRLNLVF